MKYTPSLPPITEAPDNSALREIQRARPIHAVKERLFPAHITTHHPPHENDSGQPVGDESAERRLGQERRDHCRRIIPSAPLLETRSDIERRKRNRRIDDVATSVDEEA
jgi:hypothetical protein